MNIIPDLDAARLCLGIYRYLGEREIVWDHYDQGRDDGVCYGLKRIGDVDVVVFRGSGSARDWLRDLMHRTSPIEFGPLGSVHPGFALGLDSVLRELQPLLRGCTVLTGHSLGAGRAAIMAGKMKLVGMTVARCVLFGAPRPGFARLREFVADIPAASYRNGRWFGQRDAVTGVPPWRPWQRYAHAWPLTNVHAAPPRDHPWGAFAWHDMRLYRRALMERTR